MRFLPLRLECWGGLGSQLYAIALYLELRAKFPNKPISVRAHTAGITRREQEISILDLVPNLQFVDDFAKESTNKTKLSSKIYRQIFFSIRILIRFFIAKTPFFANLDNRIIRKSDCLLQIGRAHV